MSQQDKQIIIAGAGSAGLMAAIHAARQGVRVQILERMNRPGKKLLLTGNGRCNLTNLDQNLRGRYCSSDAQAAGEAVDAAMSCFSVEKTLAFFKELGIAVFDRDGYVYPLAGQADCVLRALLRECARLGVRIRCETPVQKLSQTENGRWEVQTPGWTYQADAVIVCAGSQAAPATGSDGSGYVLAQDLGHSVEAPVPALCALSVLETSPALPAGDRCRAGFTLTVDGKEAASEAGELQWTKEGLSGVAVFSLSRHATRALAAGRKVQIFADLVPVLREKELEALLRDEKLQYPQETPEGILRGLLPARTAEWAARRCKGAGEGELAHFLKAVPFTVTGSRDFEQAQTCAGGIRLSSLDPNSLCSMLHPGLFFAGEILDIDGPCGGYNLQWAWSSGAAAGEAAAKYARSLPVLLHDDRQDVSI